MSLALCPLSASPPPPPPPLARPPFSSDVISLPADLLWLDPPSAPLFSLDLLNRHTPAPSPPPPLQVKWCANRFVPFLVIDPETDPAPGARDAEEEGNIHVMRVSAGERGGTHGILRRRATST